MGNVVQPTSGPPIHYVTGPCGGFAPSIAFPRLHRLHNLDLFPVEPCPNQEVEVIVCSLRSHPKLHFQRCP
jgi:hypothetical protein